MAKKKKKEKILNDRKRKTFRHYIGNSEVIFSALFIGFVVLMGWWFVAQRSDFDEGDRDISYEVLLAQQVEDNLWQRPLERWVEPGTQLAGLVATRTIDTGVFPPSIISNGWVLDGPLQHFDSNNLYEKINGQEVQYKSFGFVQMDFVNLALPGDEEDFDISIELYDMGEFKNALGIFAAQRSQGAQVIAEGPLFYFQTLSGALGMADKYFIKLVGGQEEDAVRDHALTILRDFASGIEAASGTPRAFMIMADGMGVPFQGIEYQLADAFQYGFASDFWFGQAADAGENARIFVHQAESEEAANELMGLFLEELEFEYDEGVTVGTRSSFEHEFLKTVLIIDQSGPFFYGIDRAKHSEEASRLLDELLSQLMEESI